MSIEDKHFYIKEIHEQPDVIERMIKNEEEKIADLARKLIKANYRRVYFVASGGALATGYAGKYTIESLAGIPISIEPASEFKDYNYTVKKDDLVIALSQSGETIHTVQAVKLVAKKGAETWTITNSAESTLAKITDHVILTHAGVEKASSTKTSTTRIAAMNLLAIHAALEKRSRPQHELTRVLEQLKQVPMMMRKLLAKDRNVREVASRYKKKNNFFVVGRGPNYSAALYSALELTEHQIPAFGFSGGEFRHGPLSLIEEDTPVICIAPASKTREKMLNLMRELKSTGATILAVSNINQGIKKISDDYLAFDTPIEEILSPLLCIVPLQVFTYYLCLEKEINPDEFRHMTKVTKID